MSGDLRLRNRQSTRNVDTRMLRRMTRVLLTELLSAKDFDLAIHLVEADAMAKVNETHLQHQGSTDVITLDYHTGASGITGELFVCVDEAILQARRFKTTWQAEVSRYIIHGILHLLGHDDLKAPARKRMKREENRLLRELDGRFHLSKLARKTRVRV